MNKNIDYVIAVAECGSISKAADMLYISQPSLSRYISKLEVELGLRLFQRSSDGISLTEAGEVYISYAKEIKRLQCTLDRKMYQIKMEQNSNHICICMTLNTSSLSTWKITEAFHRKYPACQVQFINVMSRDIQRMLDEELCDFAIGPDVCNKGIYQYREICREDVLLLVPRDRYNFDGVATEKEGSIFKWIDLTDLTNVDYVLQESSCNVRKILDQIFERIHVRIYPIMEFTNSILAIQASEQQIGCSFVSEAFLPYVAHKDKLRYYRIGGEDAHTATGIICGKDKRFSPQEKYCISLVQNYLLEEKKKIADIFKEVR